MGNLKQIKKLIRVIIIGLVVLLSGMSFLNSITKPGQFSITPSLSTSETYNQNWTHENEIIKIPYSYKAHATSASIQNTLPTIEEDEYLIFKSNYCAVEIKINDDIIYPFDSGKSHSAGDFYYFIPLTKEYSNQIITIYFYPNQYQKSIYLNNFYMSTPEKFLMNEINNNLIFIIFTAFLIVLGLILIFFCVWLRLRHTEITYNYFLYLGIFVLLNAIWLFTDSELPQIWFSNSSAIFSLSVYTFMILPYPLLCLVDAMTHTQHASLNIAKFLTVANIIVQSILHLFFDFDFMLMLPITHLLYALNCLIVFKATLALYKQKPLSFSNKSYIVSIVVLLISAIVSLVHFMVSPYLSSRLTFEFGLFLFIVILLISILHNFSIIVDTHQQTSFYKVMAYTDLSTHTLNRSAFDEQMTKLNNDQDYIIMAMFDLNELKKINDTYGHTTGDMLLKGASECIRKAFEGVGETYRYGGDEFVTIIVNQTVDMNSLLNLLSDEIADYNLTSMHPLSIAGGFAIHEPNTPLNMPNLLREADQNMYESKHHYRANKGVL